MGRRARARGFTLIEAIIAIVVVGVAVPPMLLALREVQRQRVGPVQADRARWLAGEKLEEILADRHSTSRGWSYVVTANYAAEASVPGFPGFSRGVQIEETGVSLSGAGTGFKVVRVRVGWVDGAGTARELEVATVLTEYAG